MAKTKKIEEKDLPETVRKGIVRDNLEVVLFAMVVLFFFKTFVAQNFTIPTASMSNTMMIGDHLVANKFIFAKPQWAWEEKLFPMRSVTRGDIIVFRWPYDREQDWVKRCAAMPGDKVEFRHRRLYVNDKLVTGEWEHHFGAPGDLGPTPGPWPLTRSPFSATGVDPEVQPFGSWRYLDPGTIELNKQGMDQSVTDDGSFKDNLGPMIVPPGQILAVGDNRENSKDGRFWGFLPIDHLRGRPFMVFWSYMEGGNNSTSAKIANGPGDVLANYAEAARYFFVRTRWERTGKIPR
jgi:signal peptidase I